MTMQPTKHNDEQQQAVEAPAEARQANKSMLTDSVAKELNLPRRTASLVLDAVLDSVSELLRKRGKVAIKGFGTFERRIRKGRSYTHPLTRKSIMVDDKETIMFRVSEQLNDATRTGAVARTKTREASPEDLQFD